MSARKPLNILGDDDGDDPILSVVNLIDVFLVVIAVLLIVIVDNPLNPFQSDDVVVVRNPGKPDMEIITKDGEELTRYRSSGEIGEGQGMRAGTAYRMEDGTMIYVPEDQP
ncbi:MAG TPA: DUF2149 domain-containing protein [Hyphomicrobiales bacterium]|nr:DUF2149 domain-containing protein [Hyphomicrobiales bacterium]